MEYIKDGWDFLIKEKNEIIGTISVEEDSSNARRTIPGKRIYLKNLFIKKELRRKGYAMGLLAYVFEWYGKQGIDEFTIAVDKKNVPAKALYEKLGFEVIHHGFDSYQNVAYELLVCRYRGKGAENV